MPKGVCAFCGAYGELDREHYIAQRFKKLFAVTALPDYGQRFAVYDPSVGGYRVEKVRPSRSPWGLSVRVGKRCCNNAWMRDLDNLVAPFLAHALSTDPQRLSRGQLSALAGWAAKVAALEELSVQPAQTAVSIDDRLHIKRHLRPPRGTRVWLSASEWVAPTLPGADQTTFRFPWGHVDGEPIDRKDSHSTTLYFGHVLIQLFGTTAPYGIDLGKGPRDNRLVRIWPDPPRFLAWPSAPLFTVAEARALARSIEYALTGRVAIIPGQ